MCGLLIWYLTVSSFWLYCLDVLSSRRFGAIVSLNYIRVNGFSEHCWSNQINTVRLSPTSIKSELGKIPFPEIQEKLFWENIRSFSILGLESLISGNIRIFLILELKSCIHLNIRNVYLGGFFLFFRACT